MGARAFLVYLAKNASKKVLWYLGMLALVPAVGFAYLFASGARTTGAEVFGAKIWWNSLRPLHALLYGLFAWCAMSGRSFAWMFLLADLVVGFVFFLAFHATQGNFKYLMH